MAARVLAAVFFVAAYAGGVDVTSRDGQIRVTVRDSSGRVTNLATGQVEEVVDFGSGIEGGRAKGDVRVQVLQGGGVAARHTECTDAGCVVVDEAWIPSDSSVRWVMNITGTGGNWTAPIVTEMRWKGSGQKLWCPWYRNGEIDPLIPGEWYTENFTLGLSQSARDYTHKPFVVAEHVTVLLNEHSAVSVVGDPANPPSAGNLLTSANSSATFVRAWLRLAAGVVHSFAVDIVPHTTLRDGLAWSVRRYPQYWTSYTPEMRKRDGLGSYSYYLGNATDPIFDAMGYSINWDLGGRFGPYQGMWMPPVHNMTERFANNPLNKEPHIWSSYESINAYYAMMRAEGHTALSYHNIYEWGYNVVYNKTQTQPTGHGDWRNASSFLEGYLRDALITDYTCRVFAGGRRTREGLNTGDQNEMVLDPTVPSYHKHLMGQLERRIANLSAFQGVAIDRSDWAQCYNHGGDDGVSWVSGTAGNSMMLAWTRLLRDIRARLEQARPKYYLMMVNPQGYAWLPMLEVVDGIFSEGNRVTAVGLLGLRMPSILWTYHPTDCCTSDRLADSYFQQRLYMKVFPMAPFPGNDHSISPGPQQNSYYLFYGAMFKALRGLDWLLTPRPITVLEGEVKANAFFNSTMRVYPIMLGGAAATAVVSIADAPSPLTLDVLHPGSDTTWHPLPPQTRNGTAVVVTVPLVRGCALLRAR